jgi:HAD superfamily hydrolase (TIGR01509 family)
MIRGVLFDYSGTLFRLQPSESWFASLGGPPLDETQRDELITLLTATRKDMLHLPPDLLDAWHRRDLDPETHRAVYLAVLADCGIPLGPGAAEKLYDSMLDPGSWFPYPDTVAVLRGLRTAGIPVGVVSNIAWDIRDVFRRHGAYEFVDEFLLSYAEGVMKPDTKIFTVACQRIGLPPEEVLMVGDSPHADAAAAEIGCATAIVDPLPTDQRPDALRTVLAEHRLVG